MPATRTLWTGVAAAVLLLGLGLLIPAANGQQAGEAAGQQTVIVLLNGRVISGRLEDRPGGYLVENQIGKVVIPHTQIRVTGTDLPDAYRKLQATMTEPNASAHIALGDWCFNNRLYESAREQVRAALVLEPERKEARELLKRIERMSLEKAFEATIPDALPRQRDGYEAVPVQALEGLSPAVTQDFVRRIQPLLQNKCGNARCHGAAASSDFRLAPVRLEMSGYRSLTDQNLSAVLRFVDLKDPPSSPLLVLPQGAHGGKLSLWAGPRSDEQQAELRAWVTRVALERGSWKSPASESNQRAGDAETARKRDPFLGEILAEEQPDQFDPAIFNRRMHGRD